MLTPIAPVHSRARDGWTQFAVQAIVETGVPTGAGVGYGTTVLMGIGVTTGCGLSATPEGGGGWTAADQQTHFVDEFVSSAIESPGTA